MQPWQLAEIKPIQVFKNILFQLMFILFHVAMFLI